MSDQKIAVEDTTFDNIKPKCIWVSHRTSLDRKYIIWYLEINGIEKEMSRFYVGSYDGILSDSHNVTWIIQKIKEM